MSVSASHPCHKANIKDVMAIDPLAKAEHIAVNSLPPITSSACEVQDEHLKSDVTTTGVFQFFQTFLKKVMAFFGFSKNSFDFSNEKTLKDATNAQAYAHALTWLQARLNVLEAEHITHQNMIGSIRLQMMEFLIESVLDAQEEQEIQHSISLMPTFKSKSLMERTHFINRYFAYGWSVPTKSIDLLQPNPYCEIEISPYIDTGARAIIGAFGASASVGHCGMLMGKVSLLKDYFSGRPIFEKRQSVGYNIGAGFSGHLNPFFGSQIGIDFDVGASLGFGFSYGSRMVFRFNLIACHLANYFRQPMKNYHLQHPAVQERDRLKRQKYHHMGLTTGNNERLDSLKEKLAVAQRANKQQLSNLERSLRRSSLANTWQSTKATIENNLEDLLDSHPMGEHNTIDATIKKLAYDSYDQAFNSFDISYMSKKETDRKQQTPPLEQSDLGKRLHLPHDLLQEKSPLTGMAQAWIDFLSSGSEARSV